MNERYSYISTFRQVGRHILMYTNMLTKYMLLNSLNLSAYLLVLFVILILLGLEYVLYL